MTPVNNVPSSLRDRERLSAYNSPHDVVDLLRTKKRILILTGAGVSVSTHTPTLSLSLPQKPIDPGRPQPRPHAASPISVPQQGSTPGSNSTRTHASQPSTTRKTCLTSPFSNTTPRCFTRSRARFTLRISSRASVTALSGCWNSRGNSSGTIVRPSLTS